MTESFQLSSTRLCLRRLRPEDAQCICDYRALPDVARFQSWKSFTLSDADRLIADQMVVAPGTPGTWLQLALVAVESGTVIGDCGIHFLRDELEQVEIGITLAPTHMGRGLATEALDSVLAYVFGDLHKHRAVAITDVANRAAAALFQRLGFRQEAHYVEHVWFKDAWCSEFLFALLSREWQARVGRNGV